MITEARKYQAFYTKSTPIVDYMVSKLQLNSLDKILEPCGGDGVFIDCIIEHNEFAKIDICELNPFAINILQKKYSNFQNINIRECDTLLDDELSFNSNFGGFYDKIIANPPYGAWQDYEKRIILKKMYSDLYAKESYTLFLYRCIELLKDNGILSFIIPDTFLNLHMHKSIRKHILTKTKIKELALFPSSFFPGVNFGYANLSIITLQKSNNQIEIRNNSFEVKTNYNNVEQLNNRNEDDLKIYTFSQNEILENPDYAFLISDNSLVSKTINNSKLKLGDIANCVTGFYSGNDKVYLKVNSHNLKNGKNYEIIDSKKINKDYKNINDILNGIETEKCYLPIVKGGNTKFLKPVGWYMNWSTEAVSHYKNDKKARFQNPKFYFKFGIGVPMISSSSITASLIENKLFDQSIVGIFPFEENLTYYLLAFLNSPTCNKLIRTINPSANNPANYLKKIPYKIPTEIQKNKIDEQITIILNSIKENGNYSSDNEKIINLIIEEIYGF
ncbi:Eco57I restriction-modification methylase domain-containing protein [Flavobacterium sp. HXWNR29]|uniref:Eco57I restriction-modification methylase domain-containing protein n=1 Tax=Flavobacterium odoriferum TaxID=2946604 RepID=UPI0021CB2803|nr:Eco57I restriction-modification methylase domain-containing protein [Flavobacterium sp. HXWNR29]MCU4190140.1 Eco57I restriction-modification methylase domain-containing protein [Flavobacterium sp. HXWNR29]